ncbi:unnamed protein product, partial [Prorocentrum cordatum]
EPLLWLSRRTGRGRATPSPAAPEPARGCGAGANMSVLTPRGSGQPENGESSVRERPRRQRELSLPELVEMTHVIGKLEATDDTIRVVDHCLLKIAAVENKLLDCLRKHEACVRSATPRASVEAQVL